MEEYDIVRLIVDINPVIRKGMVGTIMLKYSDEDFEVEFVKEDATNFEYGDQSTFWLKEEQLELINKYDQYK